MIGYAMLYAIPSQRARGHDGDDCGAPVEPAQSARKRSWHASLYFSGCVTTGERKRSPREAHGSSIQYRRFGFGRSEPLTTSRSTPPFFSITRIDPTLSSSQVTSTRRIPNRVLAMSRD